MALSLGVEQSFPDNPADLEAALTVVNSPKLFQEYRSMLLTFLGHALVSVATRA